MAAIGTAYGVSSTAGATGDETRVIVRAEDVDPEVLPFDADVIDELQATAAESQEPIVDYVAETEGVEVINQFWLANAMLLEVDTTQVDIDELRAQEGVSRIHTNFAFELPEPSVGASTTDQGTTYGLEQINAPDAWETFGARGEGVDVAVLDTGVDPDHPDLAVDEWGEFDGDGDRVETEPNDGHGHGTHVSGTVVGPEEPADDDVPTYGVAPDATLWGVKVLDDGGGGTFAQIIAGMEWATAQGVDVMNMSLGAVGYQGEMIEPVVNAYRAGTLLVSSSGNDGPGTSGSPANVYDSVAVGASNADAEIADFSSGETIDTENAWGFLAPDDWPAEYLIPDVAAPGVDVLSADLDGEYSELSGTSMASPHVAGLVCLLESAAEDEPALAQLAAALSTTAWSPENESGQDTRYGHGIVDAVHAISRFAADSGVDGTVTDTDGTPIEGATVELDGFPAETDSEGAYTLRALAGSYEVTADAFGYGSDSATVEVEDDAFTTRHFELSPELSAEVVTGQPEGLEAGESFDVELRVANAEGLTVALAGDYENGAALSIDGDDDARFGERYAFDEAMAGTVTVTVETDDLGRGDLALDLTVDGLGQDITLRTGPTTVFEDPVPIGVVDDGGFSADLVALLDEEMPPWFRFDELEPAAALDAAEDREHEAYVVQSLGDDEELVDDFAAETAAPEVGVVYLDQFGEDSDAVSQLSAATGDPTETVDVLAEGVAPPIEYEIGADHAVLDGVADPGDTIAVTEPPALFDPFVGIVGGFHTYYEGYRGEIAGWTIADTQLLFTTTGEGLGIDDLSRTILASSLGLGFFVGRDDVTPDGRSILSNAVEHASITPAVRVLETPAERIAPTETATLVVEADALQEVEIDVTGLEYLDEDDLTLSIAGEEAAFGEAVAFDDYDGEVTIEVGTADVIGEFAMDTRFQTRGDHDQEATTEATLRPTTVYESPIQVPDQLSDLQAAVDFVVAGDTVEVAGGTYEVDAPDRGFQTGLYIGTPDITVRGADDEIVEIVHERDLPSPRCVNIDADGVTLEGVHANVVNGAVDEKNSVGTGVIVNELTSGVTVENVTAAGTFGVQFEGNIADVTVDDVTAIETVVGVGTDSGAIGDVENATITNVTVTDRPEFTFRGGVVVDSGASGVTVTDCEIEMEDGENGIWLEGPFGGGEECLIADNEIVGTGIDEADTDFNITTAGIFASEVEAVVENNEVTGAGIGVQIADRLGGGDENIVVRHNDLEAVDFGYRQTGDYATVEENVIDAEIGVQLGDEHADPGDFFGPLATDRVLAQYNDVSETALPFAGVRDDGFGGTEGPFDCRQNYLGDRDYDETIADGDVEYDPFLTDPPQDIEFSQPTEIGTDLYLDAGGTYGLGIPGPTDLTIWDVLDVSDGGGHDAFAGEVHRWSESRERWQRVTGRGNLADQDALVGFKVEPEEGVRAVVHFQFLEDAEDAPPGRRDGNLGETEVTEGMNVVCAPGYGGEAMFDEGTATIESIEPDDLGPPGSQMGAGKSEAEKTPFNAYYVEASEAGTIECDLDEYDPTMTDVYEAFGLDPAIHEDPGAGSGDSDTAWIDDISTDEVVAAAPDDETAREAVTALTGTRIAAAVDSGGDDEEIIEDIETVIETTVAEAPSETNELVEEGVERALAVTMASLFQARVLSTPDEEPAAREFASETTRHSAEADD